MEQTNLTDEPKNIIHELIICPRCHCEIAISGPKDRDKSASKIPCNDQCNHD